ncbi:MAG TPA: hypothetical protein VF746_10415 [Longimicrobium sp.]
MIEGAVNAKREAVVDLTVSGPAGLAERLAFVVDTGFDSDVTLPAATVAAMGLRLVAAGRAVLGDGSLTYYDICEAEVVWGNASRQVLVDVAETESLLGMGLLEGHELRIEAVRGGRVRITPLLVSESQPAT